MKTNEKSWKIISRILIALSVLAAIKLILADYTMDEEYQLVMAYRNLQGDRIFGQMWEPHQTSAFACIAILFWYHLITGTYTGAVIACRVVTTLIQAGLSFWMVKALHPVFDRKLSFLLALLYFNSVPKLIEIPEFSNLQLWFFTIMVLALLQYYYGGEKTRGKWYLLVIASAAMALEVLSYPSCLILFPFTIVYLLMKSGENRFRDVLIFILTDVAAAVVWLGIVLSRVPFPDFLENVRYTVELDLTHDLSGATSGKFSGTMQFLVFFAIVSAALFLISFPLTLLVKRIIQKKSPAQADEESRREPEPAGVGTLKACVQTAGDVQSENEGGRTAGDVQSENESGRSAGDVQSENENGRTAGEEENAAGRIIDKSDIPLFLTIYLIGAQLIQLFYWFVLQVGYEYPQIHLLYLIISVVPALILAGRMSEVKPFLYGYLGGVLSLVAVFYMSDLQLFNAVPHGMMGVIWSLPFLFFAFRKASGEKGIKIFTVLLISFLITATLGKGGSFKGGRELRNVTDFRGIMKHGPAAGIVTDYICAYIYNANWEDYRANIDEGDKVLIVTNLVASPGTTPYFFGDYEICHFSIVDPTSYDERLKIYWEKYPEKQPNVIVVDCWYGELKEDEDSWIMQYIENEFGYTEAVDGRYVRFYKKD